MKITKTTSILIGVAIIFGIASNSFGAAAKCKIVKIDGSKLTVECPQVAGEFKEGQWVKMKTAQKND